MKLQSRNAFFLFLMPFICSAASLHSMTKGQIEAVFIHKTYTSIPVDNLNGKTVNDSNIIYLDGKGGVISKMGVKPKDEPQVDTGHYSITQHGAVYVQWKHWDFKKRLCFHFYETQNAYIAVDCQNVFHSVFMKSAARQGNWINEKG